jgi:hypothetical protein
MTWGLTYVLIIPACIYFFKKRVEKAIFLIILAVTAFSFPLIFTFNDVWQSTVSKFFYMAGPFFELLVGAFLFRIIKNNKWQKAAVCILAMIISIDGIFFILTRWAYPGRVFGSEKTGFIGRIKQSSPLHMRAYDWVKNNSSGKNLFLAFDLPSDDDPYTCSLQNYAFVLYTERIAPIYSEGNNYKSMPNPKHRLSYLYKLMLRDCNPKLVKLLKYEYLFADQNWPAGLENKCLKSNVLEKVFDESQDGDFVRIYKVK